MLTQLCSGNNTTALATPTTPTEGYGKHSIATNKFMGVVWLETDDAHLVGRPP